MSSIDVDFNSHKPKTLNHLKCNFTKYSIIFKSHAPHPSVGEESELPPVGCFPGFSDPKAKSKNDCVFLSSPSGCFVWITPQQTFRP